MYLCILKFHLKGFSIFLKIVRYLDKKNVFHCREVNAKKDGFCSLPGKQHPVRMLMVKGRIMTGREKKIFHWMLLNFPS